MKKIKAKFKGLNGSLGYITNRVYWLTMNYSSKGDTQITIERIKVEGTHGNGRCVYDNIGTFLDNWSNISTTK